jgi:VWFA-related protein
MHELIGRFNCSLMIAAILTIPAARGAAQQGNSTDLQSRAPTLQVNARLVVLDVVVTDHSGQVRNNLTRDDFHITEDGVPQTLLNFEPPATHEIPTGAPITSTADLEARAPQSAVDVIVLDEMNTSFQDMAFARYALKKYLNAQPNHVQAPTELIAVSFDKFLVLHDYTQDRGAILAALDHHLTHYPWNLQTGESKIVNFAKSLGALEQVAEATAGHPGHKNVIWVGKGFPGIDLSSPAVMPNTVSAITYAMHQAVNMLRDSRITLYTIDPTILTATVATTTDADSILGVDDGVMDATAPDPFAGDVNFTGLARATGGKSFYSRNDVDREIGESVRDGVNYYTISYRPTNTSDAEKPYRKIRVAFTIPGLHAYYRDGYYTQGNDDPAHPGLRLKYDMVSAEQSTMVYTGLKVLAAAKPGAQDTYVVGVPEHELLWTADGGRESAKLTVVAAAVNNRNEVLRRATVDVTAHRPSADSANLNPEALARVEIMLPPGPNTYRIRFVVRADGNGRIGTADIAIPGAAPAKDQR